MFQGVFFELETGLTLSPDFILHLILTIEPFTSPWDYVQSNEGSAIVLRLLSVDLQVIAGKLLFQWYNSAFFKFLPEKGN